MRLRVLLCALLGVGLLTTLAGPARATLRDFIVFGTYNSFLADGIEIDNCDQPGARVHFEQVDVRQASGAWLRWPISLRCCRC